MTQTLKEKIAEALVHPLEFYRSSDDIEYHAADAILSVIAESVEPLDFENISGKVYDANGCGVLYRIVGAWDGTVWGVRVAQTRVNNFEFGSYEEAAEFCRRQVGIRILSALGLSTPEQEE